MGATEPAGESSLDFRRASLMEFLRMALASWGIVEKSTLTIGVVAQVVHGAPFRLAGSVGEDSDAAKRDSEFSTGKCAPLCWSY
jgi:hypothetical protein